MRKRLTLNDIEIGDVIEPIPNFIFKKPLKIFRKDKKFFYVKSYHSEICYQERVLKYFIKRKIKRTLLSNDFK